MAFNIIINSDEVEQFLKVMALYPEHKYVNYMNAGDKYHVMFLGEDMEKDCLLQEALMEHLESIEIEENIGGG